MRTVKLKDGLCIVAISFGLSACHPWLAVLRGMQSEKIVSEITSKEADYNAKAPKGVARSPTNRWLIFIYDPKDAQSAHEAFAGSSEYCYFDVVMHEGVDEDQERPRQAAICVLERTPRPPDNEVEMPE